MAKRGRPPKQPESIQPNQVAEQTVSTKLVKMEREDGKTADVHPDMVDEYKKGGYRVA